MSESDLSKTDQTQIRYLEMLLLDLNVRNSPTRLADLLCDDFIEIGQSGTIYNKMDIINTLSEDPHTDAQFSNFDIQALSENLILAKYTSTNVGNVQRTSLWERRDSVWRMLYHEAEMKNG